MTRTPQSAHFLALRDQLLARGGDYSLARADFRWPAFEHFNWARDCFDLMAEEAQRPALRLVDDAGTDQSLSFAELAGRSQRLASYLSALGLQRGERVLVMRPNCTALWQSVLAAMRMGAVIIPATTLLEHGELADRLERGQVRAVITLAGLTARFHTAACGALRIAVGGRVPGWHAFEDSAGARARFQTADTRADEVLFLYFTSGTTARAKLVAHTHVSYPGGHLSTMYWLGVRPGDVHLNLSSPGWAQHAWSSFFAPWNAAATVLAYQYARFEPRALLEQLVRCRVSTFCAPPTVWRMLIQHDLRAWPVALRAATSAGEPLNPEVIARVRAAWGLTVRDGFGQTETTLSIGNTPGQRVKPGSMGRALPGYPVVLLNAQGRIAPEGEICLELSQRPLGLMQGYLDDPRRNAGAAGDRYYHVQVLRLPHQPVRAGECAHRASRGRGGGGGPESGSAAAGGAQGLRGARGRGGRRWRHGRRDPGARARACLGL